MSLIKEQTNRNEEKVVYLENHGSLNNAANRKPDASNKSLHLLFGAYITRFENERNTSAFHFFDHQETNFARLDST